MASVEEPIEKFIDEQLINNVLRALQEQRKVSLFCDVILKVCGEEIFAHSNILAAASPYFASFLGTLKNPPRPYSQRLPQIIEIHIEGSNESKVGYSMAVRKLVDFMYTSYLEIPPSVITQAMEMAKVMQLDTIIELCQKYRIRSRQLKLPVNGEDLSTSATDKDTSDLDLNDHTRGLCEDNDFTPEPSTENVNRDQMTQTNFLNTPSVDSPPKEPIKTETYGPNVNPVETSDVKNEQTVESIDPLLDQKIPETDTTAEMPVEEAATEPDTVEDHDTLISAPLESTMITADTESESVKEGDEVRNHKLKNDEKVDSNVTGERETSTPCSGAVRSSLRIRLGKKNMIGRHYYRKKVKVKKSKVITSNNKTHQGQDNNSTNNNTNNGTIEVYVCDECLYTTDNYNHFKRHQKIHQDGKYSCNTCDYKANRLKSLNDHKRIHLHAELQCSYCDYKATNAEELTLHLSRHDGEQPYFCYVCDMKFKTKTQLNQHMPKHSDEKPFVCTKCCAGFKWKHALKSHMVVHSETKDHLCDICGYATAHKSQLKTHRLVHTGETFKCSIQGCNFQALKRLNLKYHMLTHTNEKPHVCSVCNQSFSLIKNLKRHMLLHTNDRPYKCDHCSFKSTRYDKLKEHLLKQHNIGERPGKRQRIFDYQVTGEKLMKESAEETNEDSLQTVATIVSTTENATAATVSGTTTQTIVATTDNLPVLNAITQVNTDSYTEITYRTFQYI